MSRYARQIQLPEIGAAGQAAIAAARIVVIGAGGLGCPALQYLVGAGVGRVTIVDADHVSLSNLHRQTLYRETDVGRAKSDCARDTLATLNGDVEIISIPVALSPLNVDDLIHGADVVLDCADSFAASYILSDACFAAQTPLISGSALGMAGYIGGFCAGAPSLRAVFPDLPARGATCATAGVLGPVVGVIGAMQAQAALAHITGLTPSPLGQMTNVDLVAQRFASFRFDGAPEPAGATLGFIAPEQINPTDFIIDLRGTDEAPSPVTPDALRHSVMDFATAGPRPNPDQRAVLCCKSGLRAWQAARYLSSYWDGDIHLIALGDVPSPEA